ncbi:hypothetical protein JCM3774_001767 [Rhodotorula dairenensis]
MSKADKYKQAGNAAFARGALELALANFTTALQLDPSVAAYPLNRAAVHLKLRDWAAAERDATTALNLDGGSNPKALFRRALARKHLAKLSLARTDLEEAKRLGAGADVDAELALVLEQLSLGPTTASAGKQVPISTPAEAPRPEASTTTLPPPSPSPTAPTAVRLRAALAPLPPPPSAPSSSSASPGTSGPLPQTLPPHKGDDLLSAVSTRRLAKPPTTAAPSPFAAKKEARLVKEKEALAATRRDREDGNVAHSAVAAVTRPSEPASSAPVAAGVTTAEPLQLKTRSPSSPAASWAPSLAAISSPTALEAHFLALSTRAVPLAKGDPERYGPLRQLALELAGPSSLRPGAAGRRSTWKEWMGPAGLTPDLLSDILGEVGALFPSTHDRTELDPPAGDRHLEWVVPLLEALPTCHRWDSASLFLSTEERAAVERVLDRARSRLDALARKWQV